MRARAGSKQKVVVTLPSTKVTLPSTTKVTPPGTKEVTGAAVAWLLQQPGIQWMERGRRVQGRSRIAQEVVVEGREPRIQEWESAQNGSLARNGTFEGVGESALGLGGEGELVGIGDTGVDHDSCYFHDEGRLQPICRESPESGACRYSASGRPPIDLAHRKIVSYRFVTSFSDRDLANDGHGTLVAGAVAGKAGGPSDQVERASRFNGIVPEAKLVVDDMNEIPDDLEENLWPFSYGIGARVYVNAWGDSESEYSLSSRELDSFVYAHPDSVQVVAGGNSGPDRTSIGSPANAKNAIVVGATQNAVAAYTAYTAQPTVILFQLTRVQSQPTVEGSKAPIVQAAFGPRLDLRNPISAALAFPQPDSACRKITNVDEMKGKVALVWRGDSCGFLDKAMHCAEAGAVAVIVMNSETGDAFEMRADGDIPEGQNATFQGMEPSIPAVMLEARGSEITRDYVFANFVEPVQVLLPVNNVIGSSALAEWSSRGPTPDNRFKPDIVAPGEQVRTASSDADLSSFQCDPDSATQVASGSSMAAALVAGAAALVRQYLLEGRHRGVHGGGVAGAWSPSAALVKAVVLHSGVPLEFVPTRIVAVREPKVGVRPDTDLPQAEFGYGRVSLHTVCPAIPYAHPTQCPVLT